MPYADPERQREAVKVWQQAHPEKLKAYRKTMFMKNSIAKHRFPKQRSIQFHGLTDAEVIYTTGRSNDPPFFGNPGVCSPSTDRDSGLQV